MAPHTTQETTQIFSWLVHGSWWNSYNGNPHQHPMQIRTKLGRLTCGSHDHNDLSINIQTLRDLNFLSARSTATATWKTARNGHKVKYLFSNTFTRKGCPKYRSKLYAEHFNQTTGNTWEMLISMRQLWDFVSCARKGARKAGHENRWPTKTHNATLLHTSLALVLLYFGIMYLQKGTKWKKKD